MGVRLKAAIDNLLSSLWFYPALISLLSGLGALISLELDAALLLPDLLGVNPNGVRIILSAIVNSTMTVTGLAFSVIIVALVMASQQFSPRLLRGFMRDRTSQVVLGMFLGTFVASIVVLQAVDESARPAVPQLSVALCVAASVGCLAGLIYFGHHIAELIQVSDIIARVAEETITVLEAHFPASPAPAPAGPDPAPGAGLAIAAPRSGYIQGADYAALIETARACGGVIRLDRAVGDFVPEGNRLATVWCQAAPPEAALQRCLAIDIERTLLQDVEFGVRQLVDIALKAISPAINDPRTAMNCIDYLGAILVAAARRADPPTRHADSGGALRLITAELTFAGLVDRAFHQIRQYGAGDVAVTLRLLDTLLEIGEALAALPGGRQRRAALWHHACMIGRGARRLPEFHDRAEVERRIIALAGRLGVEPGAEARISEGQAASSIQ